ncbi:hypothetical protein C8R45DRAFT_575251 [Mycena sanguinolenta]|nr:hypothetical protein C8R45DRAFT_575251 [Mycena sanguinolenta]
MGFDTVPAFPLRLCFPSTSLPSPTAPCGRTRRIPRAYSNWKVVVLAAPACSALTTSRTGKPSALWQGSCTARPSPRRHLVWRAMCLQSRPHFVKRTTDTYSTSRQRLAFHKQLRAPRVFFCCCSTGGAARMTRHAQRVGRARCERRTDDEASGSGRGSGDGCLSGRVEWNISLLLQFLRARYGGRDTVRPQRAGAGACISGRRAFRSRTCGAWAWLDRRSASREEEEERRIGLSSCHGAFQVKHLVIGLRCALLLPPPPPHTLDAADGIALVSYLTHCPRPQRRSIMHSSSHRQPSSCACIVNMTRITSNP